jgi:hypothetical protein
VLDTVVQLDLVNRQHSVFLQVGALDPAETPSGLRTRLHHLK